MACAGAYFGWLVPQATRPKPSIAPQQRSSHALQPSAPWASRGRRTRAGRAPSRPPPCAARWWLSAGSRCWRRPGSPLATESCSRMQGRKRQHNKPQRSGQTAGRSQIWEVTQCNKVHVPHVCLCSHETALSPTGWSPPGSHAPEEQAHVRALLRLQLKEVGPLIRRAAASHLIIGVAHQHLHTRCAAWRAKKLYL